MAVTECAECGSSFTARAGAVYCSPPCRQRAYRKRKHPNPIRNTPPVTDAEFEARVAAEVDRRIRNTPPVTDAGGGVLDWNSLPGNLKQKEAAWKRRALREAEAQVEPRIQAEIQRRLAVESKLMQEMRRDYRRALNGRKGIFTRADYDVIRSCLHPDSRLSVTDAKLAKAFRLINEADIPLLNETDRPTTDFPSTVEGFKRRYRR